MNRPSDVPPRDPRAVLHPPPSPATSGTSTRGEQPHVVVIGGGIAGLASAAVLAEAGVRVTVVEREPQLGGRVASWPVQAAGTPTTMSRGFHAFFRQYYTLRSLLRRADPQLERLIPLKDYPLVHSSGLSDSFAKIPRTPPLNMLAFVARSPSFTVGELRHVDIAAALGLLDVDFPATFAEYDGRSAADVLDRLRFPAKARHLALEVFARSFFADPRDFSGGELVAMFHTYFLGSAEGLLFDVPDDDYDTALWAPLGRYLGGLGVEIRTECEVTGVHEREPGGALVVGTHAGDLEADAAVLATDSGPLRDLVGEATWLGDAGWRARVADLTAAPSFAVWRLWFDRPVRTDAPPFLGTAAYGRLDNVSIVERFEAGAARWVAEHGGSVVELHAYALPDSVSDGELRAELRDQLARLHPELDGSRVLHEEWLRRADCPAITPDPWWRRPGVVTPDSRVVLAGDGIRCELPVALMERAAVTGVQAANALLTSFGRPGQSIRSVPTTGRHRGVVRPMRRLIRGTSR